MIALLGFFAIIYFLVPLRLFFMKKMKVEAAIVLILGFFPVLYYYVYVEKGQNVAALIGAESIVLILALFSLTEVFYRFFFLMAYLVNIAIFLVLFQPELEKNYTETVKYFSKHPQ